MSEREPLLLQATGVTKTYHQGRQEVQVLRQVQMDIEYREMTAIVGASGSGKTTLLQILGTLDAADDGNIFFKGRDLTTYSDKELAAHRNANIGFIFQFHHLLPEFTALENVIMPGLIKGMQRESLEAKGLDLLERVGVKPRSHHRSGELSGGEQQRVALARALIMQPALLLADEPTGNLDSASGKVVFDLLKEMSDSMGLSVVMVTHNLQLAKRLDRCLTLIDGRLKEAA